MITWRGSTALSDRSTSGKLAVSDKRTLTQILAGPLAACYAQCPPKGALGAGLYAAFKVDQAEVTPSAGGIGELAITWIPINGDLPLDDCSLSPREMPRRIELHPRYASLSAEERAACRKVVDGSTNDDRNNAWEWIQSWSPAKLALASELLDKLEAGEETYYWSGATYEWTSHYWVCPAITPGGFIEAPGGPLSAAFGALASLRVADRVAFQNYIWKVTRSWFIAQAGAWDPSLYTP